MWFHILATNAAKLGTYFEQQYHYYTSKRDNKSRIIYLNTHFIKETNPKSIIVKCHHSKYVTILSYLAYIWNSTSTCSPSHTSYKSLLSTFIWLISVLDCIILHIFVCKSFIGGPSLFIYVKSFLLESNIYNIVNFINNSLFNESSCCYVLIFL